MILKRRHLIPYYFPSTTLCSINIEQSILTNRTAVGLKQGVIGLLLLGRASINILMFNLHLCFCIFFPLHNIIHYFESKLIPWSTTYILLIRRSITACGATIASFDFQPDGTAMWTLSYDLSFWWLVWLHKFLHQVFKIFNFLPNPFLKLNLLCTVI